MQISSSAIDNTLYIKMYGELDEYTAGYTRDKLDELFTVNKYCKIVIDMSNLTFMDSTGIGVLIGRYKRVKEYNKQIYIQNPNNQIEKIFKMSGIYEIMPKIS
ncbi:MAG: STAS domain-containing protein [Clostridiales bacterium]|nr:STAS domain-containing protein [Clostridiales bacterium]